MKKDKIYFEVMKAVDREIGLEKFLDLTTKKGVAREYTIHCGSGNIYHMRNDETVRIEYADKTTSL